jgi:hypothetical protein
VIRVGERDAPFAGVRSPPLRQMVKRCEEGLTGANRGMAPREVFSEGHTLCVRMARLNERQGIPFPPDACARGRDPKGENPPRSQCRRYGRAGPPLRGVDAPREHGLVGEGPGIRSRPVSSEGRGLRARVARPYVRRDISFPPHALTMNRWPKGGNVAVVPSLRACGARPSARWPNDAKKALRGQTRGMAPKPLFSEGRTLCVRMARLNERQGIPFPPDACARGRDPKGENPPRSQCPRYGRAEPAPPPDGQAMRRRPYGGKPGDGAKGGFLGGTHSVRPHGKAKRAPRHSISTGCVRERPGP